MIRTVFQAAFPVLMLAIGPYPHAAPHAEYLIADRNAEIALAQSAAPPSISSHATVLVLGDDGYVTAIKGSNGFVCVVERGWMSPFDSTDFWNPKLRAPICYNPPAARTMLLYTLARTKLALAGLSKTQILDRIDSQIAKNELPSPEPGSMSYMMSKHQYLGDGVGSWHSHIMFYAPKIDAANNGLSWGANLQASPVVLDTDHKLFPEPATTFMVPLRVWSDGTAAPAMK